MSASADFLLAAWFLWITPLLAALSSLRLVDTSNSAAFSLSPACGGLAERAHSRAKRRLHRLVAQSGALVSAIALLLRLDVGHASVPSSNWCLRRLRCLLWGAPQPSSDCSGYQSRYVFSQRGTLGLQNVDLRQHGKVSLRVSLTRPGGGRAASAGRPDARSSASSTATTRRTPAIRWPSMRCSTPRATSAARTRASTPSLRRRTPPTSRPAPKRSAAAFIDQGITFSLSGQERPFPAGPGAASDLGRRVDAVWSAASPSGSRPSRCTSTTSTATRRS